MLISDLETGHFTLCSPSSPPCKYLVSVALSQLMGSLGREGRAEIEKVWSMEDFCDVHHHCRLATERQLDTSRKF